MDRSIFNDTLRTANLSRTPGMQKIRQFFSLGGVGEEENEDIEDCNESCEVFLRQTWNICGVSSLFGFQQDSEVHLKLYAKKMREEVASILPHEEVTYEAFFTAVEEVEKRPSPSDAMPIRIEVFADTTPRDDLDRSKRPEVKRKNIYTGILLSWRTSVSELEYEKSLRLPLLLCRGTKSAMKAVHITLGNMFDCHVVAMAASEDDLKWLVPIILQPTSKDESEAKGEARLEYRVPGLPVTDSINIKFQMSDLAKMWKVVSRNADNATEMNFRAEHIEKFYEVLNKQILQTAGIQLGLCTLHKISLPSFTIMENKMKSSSHEVMSKVLLFFNEKALEVLHLLNFDTTASTTHSLNP